MWYCDKIGNSKAFGKYIASSVFCLTLLFRHEIDEFAAIHGSSADSQESSLIGGENHLQWEGSEEFVLGGSVATCKDHQVSLSEKGSGPCLIPVVKYITGQHLHSFLFQYGRDKGCKTLAPFIVIWVRCNEYHMTLSSQRGKESVSEAILS